MIDKKLQDHVWKHCLPKEFKEEVKEKYEFENNILRISLMEALFGHHNLTSDAEGEEMLYAEKSIVQDMAKSAIRSIQIHDFDGNTIASQNMAVFNRGIKFALETLFGSKCLPDEVAVAENATAGNVDRLDGNVESLEPEPAEPTEDLNPPKSVPLESNRTTESYGSQPVTDSHDLNKLTSTCTDDCSSLRPSQYRNLSRKTADCDKEFYNILKNSFAKDRRLNIAVQFMSAMMSNPAIFHQHLNAEEEDYILYGSLEFADALINEAMKGGGK